MAILRSTVFISCCILFIAHQLLQKGLGIHIPIIDPYLDSLLAMPIILSFLLLEKQILFRKGDHYRLTVFEVTVATLFISLVSEWLFPSLSKKFTHDWIDIILFIAGAIIFYFTINRKAENTSKRTL